MSVWNPKDAPWPQIAIWKVPGDDCNAVDVLDPDVRLWDQARDVLHHHPLVALVNRRFVRKLLEPHMQLCTAN